MPTLSVAEVAFLMVACQQLVLAVGWLIGALAFKLDRRPDESASHLHVTIGHAF